MKRRSLAALAGLLPTAAVAAMPATGEIDGHIVLNPASPVEHIGTPAGRPIAGRVAVISPSGAVVAKIASDKAGAFRLALPPGRYILRLESPGRPGRAAAQPVTVTAGRAANTVITYDAGIR